MPTLTWGQIGERVFQAGVDRGVLYLADQVGVPWNGLVTVTEKPDGGKPKPHYFDGVKYLNLPSIEEFEATIQAYTYPDEFSECDGTAPEVGGLFYGQQERKSFGLSYRTRVGNDVNGLEHGYKLHLVYNALAAPSENEYSTLNDKPEAAAFSWDLTTTPVAIAGRRPTAHLILDSTKTDPHLMAIIEGHLYGSESIAPRLPDAQEISELFQKWQPLDYDGIIDFLGLMTVSNPLSVTNWAYNPSFEDGGWPRNVNTDRNLCTNPSFEANLTGWTANGTTMSRSNTWAFSGAWSCSVTDSGNPLAGDIRPGFSQLTFAPGLSAGKTFTVAARVNYSAPHDDFKTTVNSRQRRIIAWYSVDGTTYIQLEGPQAPNTAGIHMLRHVFTFPANAVGGGYAIGVAGDAVAFDIAQNVDAVIVSEGVTDGTFWDGATLDTEAYDHQWVGPPNNASSVRVAKGLPSGRNLAPNPELLLNRGGWFAAMNGGTAGSYTHPSNGDAPFANWYRRKMITGGITGTPYTQIVMPFVDNGGTTLPGSVWLRSNRAINMYVRVVFKKNGVAMPGINGTQVTLVPNVPTVYPFAVTATGPYDTIEVWAIVAGGSSLLGPEDTYDVGGILVGTAGDYFAGNTPDDNVYTYAWEGTTNASTSVRLAKPVSLYENGINRHNMVPFAFQSNEWSDSGKVSMKVIAPTIDRTDFEDVLIASFDNPRDLQKGLEYILKVKVRVTQTFPDEDTPNIFYNGSNQQVIARAPNAVGVHELKLKFTVEDFWHLTLNSPVSSKVDVWWDSISITDSAWDLPYFDGDSEGMLISNQKVKPYWTGDIRLSPSRFTIVPDLPPVTKQGDVFLFRNVNATFIYVVDDGIWKMAGTMPVQLD